ncbi:MAG TPA: CvpA family protein [Chthoniobacterales bacterium]|nr:CvpA family protein [Chthoniobacterales bacterium]
MPLFLSAIRNPPSETGTAGSPIWQTVFISFAVALILFEFIRGWRLGILRQLMRVVAVIAGYAAAFFGGPMIVPLLRSVVTMPDIVLSALGGAILALLVYAMVASLGTILFKRTAQHSSGVVRLTYGLSGAVVGLFFGAFFIWLVLVGIRSVGSIADAQVQARPKIEAIRNSSAPSAQSRLPDDAPPQPDLNADSLMTLLARLKNSVELGPVGDVVKKTDALPTGVYSTLGEMGTVLANPDTARKFLTYPEARELSEHPKIVALRNDPEIAEMISQGRLVDLLRDPRIIDAMNDPTLADRAKKLDLKKALEYAAKR